ncbi:MAG: ABC transporter ATP-binding protein [Candidatus Sedimenticola sp. (ex Thyasira tokunagai)]
MYGSLKRLYSEFSSKEKRRLLLLVVVIIATALLQVVGIASIFPFIATASDPSSVDNNTYLLTTKTYLQIKDNRDFILVLGGGVLLTLVLTNLFLAFSTWMAMRFVVTTNNTLAFRLLQRYLNENYLFHLKRNSAELLKNITSEVNRVVNGGIMSAIQIVSKGFSALCILIFLILVDPMTALIVGTVLGLSYALIYWSIRLKLSRIGIVVTQLFTDRMRYINESIGGIKELKVLGREQYYLKQFRNNSEKIIKHQVFIRAAVDLPRFLLETIAFGGILAMTMYLLAVTNDTQSILPMISLYAFAGYRLMPALQGVFQSTASLRHDLIAVDLFYEDIKGTEKLPFDLADDDFTIVNPLPLNKNIVLNNISFQYPSVTKQAISQISLNIKANTSIGIVGSSGSGKSTLMDVLLGLLHPQHGHINIDGERLTATNLRAWQSNIGYVPQVIFLADSSVSANIAFGIPNEEIDQHAVECAAKMADLHDFISNELEQGYQTIVGERGIRMSGGQRQRIGIARALYHNPSVLILDEATSALDFPTEQAVMGAVYNLTHKKTIIMIAHRISTVKNCDNLLWLESGMLKAEGKFDELVFSNPSFKRFVSQAEIE